MWRLLDFFQTKNFGETKNTTLTVECLVKTWSRNWPIEFLPKHETARDLLGIQVTLHGNNQKSPTLGPVNKRDRRNVYKSPSVPPKGGTTGEFVANLSVIWITNKIRRNVGFISFFPVVIPQLKQICPFFCRNWDNKITTFSASFTSTGISKSSPDALGKVRLRLCRCWLSLYWYNLMPYMIWWF